MLLNIQCNEVWVVNLVSLCTERIWIGYFLKSQSHVDLFFLMQISCKAGPMQFLSLKSNIFNQEMSGYSICLCYKKFILKKMIAHRWHKKKSINLYMPLPYHALHNTYCTAVIIISCIEYFVSTYLIGSSSDFSSQLYIFSLKSPNIILRKLV